MNYFSAFAFIIGILVFSQVIPVEETRGREQIFREKSTQKKIGSEVLHERPSWTWRSKFKRKFLHSTMNYTSNGISTFNPLIMKMVLFVAWDINPNPVQGQIIQTYKTRKEIHTALPLVLIYPEMELTLVNGTLTT